MSMPYAEGLSRNLRRKLSKFALSLVSSNSQKLGNFIRSTKHSVDTLKKINSVYHIPCGNCNGVYIGQSNRRLEDRVEEHKKNINKPVKSHSALTMHITSTGHQFNYKDFRVLVQEPILYKRNLLEMYHITEHKESVNLRSDVNGLSKVYNNIIY